MDSYWASNKTIKNYCQAVLVILVNGKSNVLSVTQLFYLPPDVLQNYKTDLHLKELQ